MAYPDESKLRHLVDQLRLYSHLKQEYGAPGIEAILAKAERELQSILAELQALPVDPVLAKEEPNDLAGIRQLRPFGHRQLWERMDPDVYREKLEGAFLGRMAGCILGAPVEGAPVTYMENLARENQEPFPPVHYWKYVPNPFELRGERNLREAYTSTKMDGVPVDDDIAYTLLGLFILEEYGLDFRTEDVGRAWLKFLPFAYTAEEMALRNLKAGIPVKEAGEIDNPYTEWIGADIRSDPWGYVAPGWPELAAEMAYRDAYLSHRRQGIYGEMFFSAVISAAFHVNDPLEAIQIGLSEIPANCLLAQHVQWALTEAPHITNYRQARQVVEERFSSMDGAHTLNNACLTIFGLAIGRTDFSRVIGETVAMGMDNDCTAATAGSIVGAIVGKAGIPQHWFQNFNNRIDTYLIGIPQLAITDVLERFTKQAMRIYEKKLPS
jgi:ADP-ribosylglycohydrolase